MRIVVASNVFVSAVLKANSLPYLVVRWIGQYGGLLKSHATEQEILHVLGRPHIAAVTASSCRGDLTKLSARAELVTIVECITVSRDRSDENGRADLIVAGDSDLLVLDWFRDISILTPAAFLRRAMQSPRGGSRERQGKAGVHS